MADNDKLKTLTSLWHSKLKLASKYKEETFGKFAKEAMRFYAEPTHAFMYEGDYGKFVTSTGEVGAMSPTFRATLNKVAELEQIFGAFLYHRNPHRQVTPRKPWVPPRAVVFGMPEPKIDETQQQVAQLLEQQAQGVVHPPEIQQSIQQFQFKQQEYEAYLLEASMAQDRNRAVAGMIEEYLNYTPNELNLRGHMRKCISEALIKGAGVIVTELFQPQGSNVTLVGSFADTVDNWLFDPDMESMDNAKWCARRRCRPKWEVEREWGLPAKTLKGGHESFKQESEINAIEETADGQMMRKQGRTNDLVVYWEIYSRMGAGMLLAGADEDDRMASALEQFGPNVYMVICEDVNYPLNLSPDFVDALAQATPDDETFFSAIGERLAWPTPFHADNRWPCELLYFHEIPRKVWPMAHITPALGEQRQLNWARSFQFGHMRIASRQLIAIDAAVAQDVETVILKGTDQEILKLNLQGSGRGVSESIQYVQAPGLTRDFFEISQLIENDWEKRTGVNEVMYAESTRQMRSAKEAQLKGDYAKLRPDDMAEVVEAFATNLARKEAFAARVHLEAKDVAPIFGMRGSAFWMEQVHTEDTDRLAREFDYRIEAGSTRKPNRDRDVANTGEAVQVVLPVLAQFAAANPANLAALNAVLAKWCQARDMDFIPLEPPLPPQPDPAAAQQSQLEQQKAEMEMQKGQQELQLKQAEMQMSAQAKQFEMQLDARQKQLEMAFDALKARQELSQDAAVHGQEMAQDKQRFTQESQIAQATGEQKVKLAKQQAQAKKNQANGQKKPDQR